MAEGDGDLARTMAEAGDAADAELGDTEIGVTRAACPLAEEGFTLRLEHRSRYTASPRYSKKEWVPARDFIFLVGQGRKLSVRVAEPEGAVARWEVTPIETRSGTLPARTGTGNQFDYVPVVTVAQRPITGVKGIPNKPVAYRITATVTHNGVTKTQTEVVTQDERDIIRQEYVDFRTWYAMKLHVPYRDHIVPPKIPGLEKFGNYNLVVDSAMTKLIEETEVFFRAKIRPSSAWRNPRRNRAAKGAVNSNHQHGGAVDMQPAGKDRGAKGRRPAMVKLYDAAMQVKDTVEVILEDMSTKLYPIKQALPEPSSDDPDRDGDGLPDRASWSGRTLAARFDQATHVHIGRAPPEGGEDD